MTAAPSTGLRIASTLRKDGTLVIDLQDASVAPPGPEEVVVRIEAAPVNASDLLSLLGPADPRQARFESRISEAASFSRRLVCRASSSSVCGSGQIRTVPSS